MDDRENVNQGENMAESHTVYEEKQEINDQSAVYQNESVEEKDIPTPAATKKNTNGQSDLIYKISIAMLLLSSVLLLFYIFLG